MCDICEKRKTLALKGLEAKQLASQLEAAQMNYLVACSAKNRAAADSVRAEYHRLIDNLLDLHAVTADLKLLQEILVGLALTSVSFHYLWEPAKHQILESIHDVKTV